MKSMGIIFVYIVLSNLFISKTWAQDITGMWKTIDDKSGYARAKVNIYKINDGSYEGKIEEVYPLPGHATAFTDKCFRCKGELQDAPLKGMKILYGFKKNPNKVYEYSDGHIIDPMSGNVYKGRIKTNASVTRMNLRGYMGTSALGRTQVWMKVD
ncbi:DUF2147 domain-containing protein [Acinetobacter haemolyticus]|uniref:DUF2147 domain-containing protein n=1 Tax=Acinetobacter haemolyticus TaxID=29430 RepID=A0A4P7B487_ACIHA|nr:DUF2147 domain-containing protein [Acinetobacter haemolyticus]QBQ16255.1 DUF2147 domain-containing protein [Acinetobacter haemolyticus]